MNKLYQRLVGLVRMLWREVAKFGVVGGVAWVIDSGIYLYLMNGPMHSGEVWAKGYATVVASIFSWAANRYWTFRHRKQNNVLREFVLFAVMNIIGLLIAAGCVAFTKYVLDMNSKTALFVAGSVVGLVLGTIFRYFAYRFWVFNDVMDEDEAFKDDHDLLRREPGNTGVIPTVEAEALRVARDLEGAGGFDPEAPLTDEAKAEIEAEAARPRGATPGV